MRSSLIFILLFFMNAGASALPPCDPYQPQEGIILVSFFNSSVSPLEELELQVLMYNLEEIQNLELESELPPGEPDCLEEL